MGIGEGVVQRFNVIARTKQSSLPVLLWIASLRSQ
jgi:hypothetical protein